jgi:type IV pilus assembly protein PilA
MTDAQAPTPPTSKLAIWSLVLSILCTPIGLVMAIIALIKISGSKGALGGNGWAIGALVVSLGCVPLVGGMGAAIAIPSFVKFQCKSMQSEARVQLQSMHVAQSLFQTEKQRYATLDELSDFNPISTRYRFEVVEASKDGFLARATGMQDVVEGDVWEIDETGNSKVVANACE